MLHEHILCHINELWAHFQTENPPMHVRYMFRFVQFWTGERNICGPSPGEAPPFQRRLDMA
jgi:hypothetical protein